MNTRTIFTDTARCIHCGACEHHCREKNELPPGLSLGSYVAVGPTLEDGRPSLRGMFLPCQHCDSPPCVAGCPTGAMTRRPDGVVFVEQTRCTGCGACALACPWRVPRLDPRTGRMVKCDLCRDRLDQGEPPACVLGCATHALRLVSPAEASASKRARYAARTRAGR